MAQPLVSIEKSATIEVVNNIKIKKRSIERLCKVIEHLLKTLGQVTFFVARFVI